MVGTTGTVDTAAVHEIQERLRRRDDYFIKHDPFQGSVNVHFGRLATVVAEILAEHTTALHVANAAVRAVTVELRRELASAEDTIAVLRYDLDAAREGDPTGGAA